MFLQLLEIASSVLPALISIFARHAMQKVNTFITLCWRFPDLIHFLLLWSVLMLIKMLRITLTLFQLILEQKSLTLILQDSLVENALTIITWPKSSKKRNLRRTEKRIINARKLSGRNLQRLRKLLANLPFPLPLRPQF